jgi:hypothetical protein
MDIRVSEISDSISFVKPLCIVRHGDALAINVRVNTCQNHCQMISDHTFNKILHYRHVWYAQVLILHFPDADIMQALSGSAQKCLPDCPRLGLLRLTVLYSGRPTRGSSE